MSTTKRITPLRARQQLLLRERAVLFEGDREREREAQKRAPGQRRNLAHLSPEQLAPYPLLAAYVAEHGGFAPRTRTGSESDAAPCLARLEKMAADGSELVLLTWTMRRLDHLPLKSEAVKAAGQKLVEGMLKVQARRARVYEVAIQRGGRTGCTHAHLVLHVADLSSSLQAAALAAPAGKGGGVDYVPGKLHVVRIKPTAADREHVASYLKRDPDCRFDLPDDHPNFLQAHEEELARKLAGAQSPRLSWNRKA